MQVAALCRDESGKVLLITSRGTGRWIVPKGWPMPGRSLAEAAKQEAWEEAGVCGRVEEGHIGTYTYDKVQDAGYSIPIEVRVYPLAVKKLAMEFPESEQRERKWFMPDKAAELVDEAGLKKLLRSLAVPDGSPV
ncbi:NUDIX hydrolase [Paracoccus laeviglucosivorans]|uniref:8-oxo-dGTP pyrophosphatase MutT, NUDIX family n=1 Tax=Paracoccus laeviglucosivorans TaxID=1197861 RepID=A0A521AUQ1_9RHOB|nr:8-oxo-dGTP pyrophosphatase MutT, NUDIX family [Paracoccus laeviglucosivorans]